MTDDPNASSMIRPPPLVAHTEPWYINPTSGHVEDGDGAILAPAPAH